MGSSETKLAVPPVTHEQIVSVLIARNAKNKKHIERITVSTEVIVCTLVAVVILLHIYMAYMLITNYERMRTQTRINNTVCLNNLKTSVVQSARKKVNQ